MAYCLAKSTTGVLVVEDFGPFRSFIRSLLGANANLQVVGEACDGQDAVEKAQRLKPGVILMDISLPGLDGLEATRQIREFAPSSKIVFVTQEDSVEVVQEAFRLGASGYIVKKQAGKDLLPGLSAVLQGQRFVSSGLNGNGLATTKGPDKVD